LTTDNVRPSAAPNAWQIGNLTIAGVIMGIGELLFCTAILVFGVYRMGFTISALQTLAFVVIVFGNQATTYTNRERICGRPAPASGSSSRLSPIS
jgi:H+-transporting ATPase